MYFYNLNQYHIYSAIVKMSMLANKNHLLFKLCKTRIQIFACQKIFIYMFYADSNAVISDVLLLSALKRNFSDLKVLHVQSNTNHPDIIQTFVFVAYTSHRDTEINPKLI